jgi:uncharacterized protein
MDIPDRPISNKDDVRQPSSSVGGNACMRVINTTRNTEVALRAEVAKSAATRSKGLLGRKGLERGGGLWIVPCESVHTFFMQFALDLIYLDRKLRVKKVRRNVSPWRISACLTAHSVLELPVGTVQESQTRAGDQLEMSSLADNEDDQLT